MGSVLLHIAHDKGDVDVALADDAPVAELLPGLVTAAGVGTGETPWQLASPQGDVLAADMTLRDASVLNGGTLRLVTERTVDELPPPPPPEALPEPLFFAPEPVPLDIVSPWERTHDLLPRLSTRERAGLAARALVRSRADATVPLMSDLYGGPSPGELTMARSAGPIGRARIVWQNTDYLRGLQRRIEAPRLTHCATMAVVSPKGGVGKTTVTALLGMLLAHERHDRVIAIDTNPDYGSLGRTLAPAHDVFVDDLLAVLDHPTLTATQLDASLARARHGLLVLPSPTAPERMARLDAYGYSRVIEVLEKTASVILLDCGTGLWEPAAQVALATSGQVMLVTDAEPATASLVAEAAQQLRALDVPVILVVNRMERGGRLDVERFAQSVRWAHGLVTIPEDRRAAAAIGRGDFDWDRAPRSWRIALSELGALVAADWERLGLTL